MNIRLTCKEIARIAEGELVGNGEIEVFNLNRIEEATEGEITFYANPKYKMHLEVSQASCLIVPMDFECTEQTGRAYIKSDDPYVSFVRLMKFINDKIEIPKKEIHPSAVVDESAVLDESVYIGANCVVGKNVVLAQGVRLYPGTVIYDDVEIGEDSVVWSNVVIKHECKIGAGCVIYSGAIIGEDGFGYIELPDKSYIKVPQLGNVELEDDVEIGANTTIDRAMVGSTIIHRGAKIDNLVQIAHNVQIGEDTAIASQTGISGSTKVGKRNRFGGQVGIAGHIEMADDVVLQAQSGVEKSKPKGIYFGAPAKDFRLAFKIEAALKNLPQIDKDVFKLKKQMEELKK
jgi:UDP-3-O-[3-hydroxymyristoyl] glucosamine N-acyltransferase